MMNLPNVSCIMPTRNRPHFIKPALDNFLKQDYLSKQLIIFDDSDRPLKALIPKRQDIIYYHSKLIRSIGLKRNFACDKATGEIIVHLDDDDWYAPNWVSRLVEELITSKADISGMNQILFHSLGQNQIWQYADTEYAQAWVHGATMGYWKSFWKQHPFKDFQAGEDNDFILNNNAHVHSFKYTEGYLGVIHRDNIAMVPYENPREKITVMKWMKTLKKPERLNSNKVGYVHSQSPLVTCIMPIHERREFLPTAIRYFLQQDYPNTELVIVDDSAEPAYDLIPHNRNIKYFYSKVKEQIGIKRNKACNNANGEIIIHWDDDDWYAEDWISHQVTTLLKSNADICGLDQIQFHSIEDNRYWMTKNYNSKKLWLSGATLVYRKDFWEKHPFKDIQIGEDDDFVRNNGAIIFAHDYYQGFIATIHSKNTSVKVFQSDPK